MLWLCLYFSELPLELREPRDIGCVAITDRVGSRRVLIACNEASREAGLHRGLDATTALAQRPTLKLIDRSRAQEQASLHALAGWAEQFSSKVCMDIDRWLIWIEIGASLHYFQGLEALTRLASQRIDALGYTALRGIAPTLEASALLARHARAIPILQRAHLRDQLAPLPLGSLAISSHTIDALHGIGWKRIGELIELPRDQLARRFGPDLTTYLERLLGECADPRGPYRAPALYHRSLELTAPVIGIEPLLFALRRMLNELQGSLRAQDTALQSLRLTLRHEKLSSSVVELRTTAPERDAQRLLHLLREILDRTVLPAPTDALVLDVDRFIALGDTQRDLFDDNTTRNHAWASLLDKLRARLGQDAVRRLGLRDDHRPEKAWCILKGDLIATALRPSSHARPERPLWLLAPQLLHHLPPLLGTPERIEAGWWSGEDVRREYYIAATEEGSRWWLYRDAHTQRWYLHGLWA